jgi:hypothetical protein
VESSKIAYYFKVAAQREVKVTSNRIFKNGNYTS